MAAAIARRQQELAAEEAESQRLIADARAELQPQLDLLQAHITGFVDQMKLHGIEPAPIRVCAELTRYYVEKGGLVHPWEQQFITDAFANEQQGWKAFVINYGGTTYGNETFLGHTYYGLVTTDGTLLSSCYEQPADWLPWHMLLDLPRGPSSLPPIYIEPDATQLERAFVDGAAWCISAASAIWYGPGIGW
jgi:hypothetical protein